MSRPARRPGPVHEAAVSIDVIARIPTAALAKFAAGVRRACTARGWSPYELAAHAKVPPAAALQLARPRYGDPSTIRWDYCIKIAEALGLGFTMPQHRQAGTGAPLFPCACGRLVEIAGAPCGSCRRRLGPA